MPLSDKQVLAEKLDLEMIERPHLWPCVRRGCPMLFLQRTVDGSTQTAMCLLDTPAVPQDLPGYVVCAYLWPKERGENVSREIIHYRNAEAVRADGWIVD